MVQPSEWIWLNGEFVSWDQSKVHVLSHGLHYGFGAFEGIRAYPLSSGGVGVFALREHMQRLLDSAAIATLEIEYSLEELCEATRVLLDKNNLNQGAYIRPIALTGMGEMGISAFSNPTTVAIAAWNWGAYLGAEGIENGIRCMISSYRRARSDAAFHKAKLTGQYLTSIMAKREAMKVGFDEAILLGDDGEVCEGSGENIFVLCDGVLHSPGLGAPILGGLTRRFIIDLARELSIEVRETNITREQLYTADEVFLTGTAAEVTPVREIDHRPIGKGRRGPITHKIQQAYQQLVRGEHPRSDALITKV